MLFEYAYILDKGVDGQSRAGGLLLESVMTEKGPVLLAAILSSKEQGESVLAWFYEDALPILLEEEFHHGLKSTFLRKMGKTEENIQVILLYGRRYFSAGINPVKREFPAEKNAEEENDAAQTGMGRICFISPEKKEAKKAARKDIGKDVRKETKKESGKEARKETKKESKNVGNDKKASLRFGRLKKKDLILLCNESFIEKIGEDGVCRKMGQIGFDGRKYDQPDFAEAAEGKMQEIKRRLRSRGEKKQIAAICIWAAKS